MHDATDLQLIRDSVARFADERIVPARQALNHYPDQPLPERLVDGLAELGLFDLDSSGSSGPSALALVLETIARRAAAPAALLLAHHVARELVRTLGAENGASHWLSGARLAFPLYDEPATADHGISLTKSGGVYQLDGTARLVVGAPLANGLVLPVVDREIPGVALVVIEPGRSGVELGPALLTLGMRGCPTSDVTCTHLEIGPDRLLARPPDAEQGWRAVARRLRAPAIAIATGLVAQSLSTALEYAKERYQGGQQIVDHDEVRILLSGLVEDHALCQLAVERLAAELSEPEAAALFSRAKQRAARATCDGVQLLGGNGYMEEYDQERCMRDARQAQCLFGRADWARLEAVGALRAESAR